MAIVSLFAASGVSGNYSMIRSLTTGKVWNGSAMVTWNVANWLTYNVAAPEDTGSGAYIMTIPGSLPADAYQGVLYTPVGVSSASGDSPVQTENFAWDGSNLVWVGSALNVGQINGSAAAAVKLGVSAGTFVTGAAAAGTLSTTQMTTNLSATVANIYAGRVLYFTSGVNAGLAVLITAYAVTGGRLTFVAYGSLPAPAAPSAADQFVIF